MVMIGQHTAGSLPVTAVVVTKNEESRLAKCLEALSVFSEVIVVDSQSTDQTVKIARSYGCRVIDFCWNGQYPKKRQWTLDTVSMKNDWVFFVDADEVVTPELIAEMSALDFQAAGYFIKGRYVFGGRVLRHGLRNNKLALINRHKMMFPVVDDIGLPGMGEIEGHYQPVLKPEQAMRKNKTGAKDMSAKNMVGQLHSFLLHNAYEDRSGWEDRHKRYAAWEKGMNDRKAWPEDPVVPRRILKRVFRVLPFRPAIAFVHCYLWCLGVLDGKAGFNFAFSRYRYYRMIQRQESSLSGSEPVSAA